VRASPKRVFGAARNARDETTPLRARMSRERPRARFYPPAREFACRGWFSPLVRALVGVLELGVVLMLFATARRSIWSTSRLWIFHERLKRPCLLACSFVCLCGCLFVCLFVCLVGCLFVWFVACLCVCLFL
jgi:hypothetical protein